VILRIHNHGSQKMKDTVAVYNHDSQVFLKIKSNNQLLKCQFIAGSFLKTASSLIMRY
jgi:hypothetical protein